MRQAELLQSNNSETQEREVAINQYLAGEKVTAICHHMGRSRTWFYKALSRYRQGGRAALVTQSRRPHSHPNQTDEAVEAAIVRIRKAIAGGEDPVLRYGNIGAETIASELEKTGLIPPSITTINRILRKHGLQQPRLKRGKKRKLPQDYPWPCVTEPNQLHLLDFVTRTTGTIRRVYGCNLLDQVRQLPFMRLTSAKSRLNVVDFMVGAWQEVGLPNALYIDNDTVWRGSSFGKRSFSFIVRLCLLLGIEVIFTPPYTPEANPLIESFNGIWDRNFWRRTSFDSLQHMATELPHFETWCRERRPLPGRNRRSPIQLYPDFIPVCLPDDFSQHQLPSLPLTEGFVHFIRFIDPTGNFSLLNEQWILDTNSSMVQTIRATIDTAQQKLSVFHQPNPDTVPMVISQFSYRLTEKVLPLSPKFQRAYYPLWPISELFNC